MVNSVTINIGGKERLACFGIQSVMELQEHYGGVSELAEAFKKQDFSLFTNITYYTLKSGVNSKGGVLDFTITEIFEWVYEKKDDDDLINLVAEFSNSISRYINDLSERLKESKDVKVEPKKKQTGQKK